MHETDRKLHWLCPPARVSVGRRCEEAAVQLTGVGLGRAFEPIGPMRTNRFIVEYEERPEGGHIARLTIDNRAKLNSLNRALMSEIVETMRRARP